MGAEGLWWDCPEKGDDSQGHESTCTLSCAGPLDPPTTITSVASTAHLG